MLLKYAEDNRNENYCFTRTEICVNLISIQEYYIIHVFLPLCILIF
jgi:hypothetical protein